MTLSIDDFRVPKFVKAPERYPFGEDRKDKFYATTGTEHTRRYRSGKFPQQGYNVNDNKSTPSEQSINNDEYTLRPY